MNETKTYNKVNKVNVDVGIVGAGVLGLLLAKKLGDLGYRIALIEKSKTLANGPSTRNHGWLHRGTYHSATIEKEDEAKRVTERLKILQPKKNYIFAIPGKMTEAPYVADEIVRMIFNNNSSELITLRPCDMFEIMTKS